LTGKRSQFIENIPDCKGCKWKYLFTVCILYFYQ